MSCMISKVIKCTVKKKVIYEAKVTLFNRSNILIKFVEMSDNCFQTKMWEHSRAIQKMSESFSLTGLERDKCIVNIHSFDVLFNSSTPYGTFFTLW